MGFSIAFCLLVAAQGAAQDLPIDLGGDGKRLWLQMETYRVQADPFMIPFVMITDGLGGPFGRTSAPYSADGLTIGIKGPGIDKSKVRVFIDGKELKPKQVEWGGRTTFYRQKAWTSDCIGGGYRGPVTCWGYETSLHYRREGASNQATVLIKLEDLPLIEKAQSLKFEINGQDYECLPEHLSALRLLIATYVAEKKNRRS
jgi:hypothetical protein